MEDRELGTSLAILRVAQGLSQEEMARLSGIRSGSISDYECGRMTPGLKTLKSLVGGMGYSLAAIEYAQNLLLNLETDRRLRPAPDLDPRDPGDEVLLPTGGLSSFLGEAEEVAIQGGRFLYRLIRLLFLVLTRHVP